MIDRIEGSSIKAEIIAKSNDDYDVIDELACS